MFDPINDSGLFVQRRKCVKCKKVIEKVIPKHLSNGSVNKAVYNKTVKVCSACRHKRWYLKMMNDPEMHERFLEGRRAYRSNNLVITRRQARQWYHRNKGGRYV